MQLDAQESVLYLSGDITVKSVNAAALRQFEQACAQTQINTLDLQGVRTADSACISLLLTALRLKTPNIALRNLPPSVSALAELYEIQNWVHA